MSASLLQRAPELSEQHKKTVERLGRAAERLVAMVGPLAELTRLFVAGAMQLERRPVQLHDLCRQVIRDLEADHPGRVLFEASGDGQGSWDLDRLVQVVHEVTMNALDHGAPSEPVLLSAEDDGDMVQLTVGNAGAIAPDVAGLLFDPFARAELPHTRRSHRLGLGLYLADQAVRAHAGTLTVSSDGDRTTATLRLPRG